MISKENIGKVILQPLKDEIKELPDNFYDSFRYTKTGNNLTHPITLGILCKIIANMKNVSWVGIDVRLNLGNKQKFQPDLVAYGEDLKKPVLFLDYESPNSSDARVPIKDVRPYAEWVEGKEDKPPYIIITTLPKSPKNWQVRWTGINQYNFDYREQQNDIANNPHDFWYRIYKEHMNTKEFEGCNIYFVNIDDKKVVPEWPSNKTQFCKDNKHV